MKTSRKFIFVLILSLSCGYTANAQTTHTWIGGSGSWSDPNHWDTGLVPSVNDNAMITENGTYTVTLDIDTTIADITIGGTSGTQSLALTNRTFTINGTATINDSGQVNLINSNLNGAGSLVNYGTFSVIIGTLDVPFDNAGFASFSRPCGINNSLTTQPGSTLRIYTEHYNIANLTVADGFTNNGLLQFVTVYQNAYSALTITSGTLTNAPGGIIESNIADYPNQLYATLDNQGSLILNNTLIIDKASAAHSNSGTITASGGNLTLTQTGTNPSFTNTGTLTIDSTRILTVNGGLFDYSSGSLTLNGTLTANNATINFIPSFINTTIMNLNSSTLTCNAPFTNQDKLNLVSSTINGSGSLTNQDTLSVIIGTLDVPFDNAGFASFSRTCNVNNSLTTQPGSILRIYTEHYNPAFLTVANQFTNTGRLEFITVYQNAYARLDVTNGTLTNAPGAIIESNQSDYANQLNAELDNQGSLELNDDLTINKLSAAHTNSGTIIVSSGNLILSQTGTNPSFTNTGTLTVDSTRVLTINGGLFDYSSGSFTLNGTLTANNATINFIPSFINTTTINLNSSTLTCSASFTNQDKLNLVSSTINGSGSLINEGTLLVWIGTLDVPFDNAGFASFSRPCSINNSLTTQPGSTLGIYTEHYNIANLTVADGFTNNGLLQFVTVYQNAYSALTITSGTLTNAPGGIIESNVADYPNQLYATLDNQGSLILNHTLTINEVSAAHTNSGTITVNGANEILKFMGTSFANQSSGSLNGRGTIDVYSLSSWTNTGVINPGTSPGKLNITGNLPQESNSVINIELAGTVVDTLYDQLNTSGLATLGGELNINLINGFVPNAGDQFCIMNFDSGVDSFAPVNGWQIGSCKYFTIEYSDTAVWLVVEEVAGNSPPVANPDSATALQDTSITINLLSNDTDPENDPISIFNVSQPLFGSVQIESDSTVIYDPQNGFMGMDSFAYIIQDQPGCFASSMVVVRVDTIAVGIEVKPVAIPTRFNLAQNYPNPFNPETTIRFDLPKAEKVTLKVFDILGREVLTMVDKQMPAGSYEVILDAATLSSGIYLYRIQAGNYIRTRRMVLLK